MSESGIPLPAPSGTGFKFYLISHVSTPNFEAASAALDRALLRQIGLPEEVEVREFENTINKLTEEVRLLAKNFSLSALIAILPGIVIDTTALWEKLAPKISNKIERKEFITKVVRYVYRKNDPDIPFIPEPFETMVENMIIDAIPGMVDNLEQKLSELVAKIASFLK